MSEYIRREDAIKAFCESCDYCNLVGGTRVVIFDNCPFTEQFRKLPKAVVEERFTAANVVERKRGKWLDIRIGIGTRGRCSECKSFSWIDPFCPKCGAEMVYPAEVSWMESENDE